MPSALQFADYALCAIQRGDCGMRHHLSGGKEAEGRFLVCCSVLEVAFDEAIDGHTQILAPPAILH